MSGLVGLLNLDGAPVDRRLLAELTASLRFRGPDAEHLWIDGPVGFGHTLLATTDEATRECQPHTLDGATWIVADARIDGRDELRRQLLACGRADTREATDVELILHAYHAWGDGCVDHLIGDFAFAIWSIRARSLFCARDHFGGKPFFYASGGRTLVFSNTLETVRLSPSVSSGLDDLAVADFLLFKRSLRDDATAFAGIRRLPAGHCLTSTPERLTVRRFWTLSEQHELRYRTDDDYVEHFRELFTVAVRDRLRTRRVAVSLSGGLDSPLVAATAKSVLSESGLPFALVGHTMVYDHLFHDEERRYTTLVGEGLGIPVRFLAADDRGPFDRRDEASQRLPEPGDSSYRAMYLDFWSAIAADARVVLTGSDADGLLNELVHERFQTMFRDRRFVALGREVATYVSVFRRRPPIGLGALLQRTTGSATPAFPDWLADGFVKRLDLRSRWSEYWRRRADYRGLRPRAMRAAPLWNLMFEAGDSQITKQPIEYRRPFADRRVVDFLLAVPVVPWCTEKTLLRVMARGVLPETVRTRAKTPLTTSPIVAHFRRDRSGAIHHQRPAPGLETYIDYRAVSRMIDAAVDDRVHECIRPVMFNWWMGTLSGAENGAGNEKRRVEVGSLV